MMEMCFKDLFDKTINNIASIFDKRIHSIMDETFESQFSAKILMRSKNK